MSKQHPEEQASLPFREGNFYANLIPSTKVRPRSAPIDAPALPSLENLHQRHPGLTPNVSGAFSEAARVCLDRRHEPPTEVNVCSAEGEIQTYGLEWEVPGDRERSAHANELDATRDGAYGLSLAACEAHLRLVAVARAEALTGADYYVGPVGTDIRGPDGTIDLENAIRLEVSGIAQDDRGGLWRQRMKQKLDQARRGTSSLPAVASVVVFYPCQVQIREA